MAIEQPTARAGVSWPRELKEAAVEAARQNDETLSRYIRRLVREDIERSKATPKRRKETTA